MVVRMEGGEGGAWGMRYVYWGDVFVVCQRGDGEVMERRKERRRETLRHFRKRCVNYWWLADSMLHH